MKSKQKQVIARLRKCGQVDRYIIRHYHKGPVAAREYAKRKYPWLFYIDEKPMPQRAVRCTV